MRINSSFMIRLSPPFSNIGDHQSRVRHEVEDITCVEHSDSLVDEPSESDCPTAIGFHHSFREISSLVFNLKWFAYNFTVDSVLFRKCSRKDVIDFGNRAQCHITNHYLNLFVNRA